MQLHDINKQCDGVIELCQEQYRYMMCVRKYLHDFSAISLINQIDPCCIHDDPHLFCVTYAKCEEVDTLVQRFLEGT